MKWDQLSIEAVCESSILIRFSNEIDTQLPKYISAIAEVIVSEHQDVIMSVTPSYTTLLIDYLPFRISEQELLTSIANLLHSIELYPEEDRQQSIVLPVYYHESVAPDLISVMEDKKLTLEQLIELHTGREYTVCAIGFAPGFAFLAHVDQVLATPRLATPRLKVLKGSVGIADTQTAVYPSDTPGGGISSGIARLNFLTLIVISSLLFVLAKKCVFSLSISMNIKNWVANYGDNESSKTRPVEPDPGYWTLWYLSARCDSRRTFR
ncbi:allophanate hydrolase subunit 1 [Vibrio hannami]|uniref:5-oxoprolinase subunit B family protein n=1 Tax=Vibrio hannami TaxID=2717094 RepID=UPI0030CA24AE